MHLRPQSSTAERRTTSGLPRAEARIAEDIATITRAVEARLGDRLSALLLVGGYARGEGSVVERDGTLGPYNDYDLVFVAGRGSISRLHAPLVALGHDLSKSLGVDVDFWPVARAKLASLAPTLFWLDVKLGAVEVLAGDEGVLDDLPNLSARDVPLAEAARLLSNRAVGLALSNLEAEDRDLRRARHGHKAVLACGDALLLAADLYRPTIAARAKELARLEHAPAVRDAFAELYADAATFRARPDVWSPPRTETLESWYARVVRHVADVHLAFEARRVGAPASPAGYAVSKSPLFRGAPDVSRLPISALRAAFRGRAPLTPWIGHPRERLARVAVALAYQPRADGSRAIAARLLGLSPTASDRELHRALSKLSEVAG
jgi:hypothetical protein